MLERDILFDSNREVMPPVVSEAVLPSRIREFEVSDQPFLPPARFFILKRGIDLVLGGAILIGLSPFLVFLGLLIWLDSPGAPIYAQWRKGMGGRPFLLFKFRTMFKNAHLHRARMFAHNEVDGIIFKMKKDPRVTRIGQFLRLFSLDEFPQLLNVIKGDMSLVGPRPFSVEVFENGISQSVKYDNWLSGRHAVKPGMTGLWQVSGRNNLPFEKLVKLDLYYVKNCSWRLDLSILFRTFTAVLSRKGAY